MTNTESQGTNENPTPLVPAPCSAFTGHSHKINSVAFSPDGKTIVTGSRDKTARVWNIKSKQELLRLKGHTQTVNSATFSPDGTRIVTASGDYTARIWDAQTGKVLQTLEGHDGFVNCAAFSPDGRRIVTGSADGSVRIWDAYSGEELRKFVGHTNWVLSAAFSIDGTKVVTAGSWDLTARLWDVQSGKELLQFRGHLGRVNSAAFSPGGNTIVTASDDGTARIWDANTGNVIQVFEGHRGRVQSAAFLASGAVIITHSRNGSVRIWDTVSGRTIKKFGGYLRSLTSAACAPLGRRVVTVGYQNITVWALPSLRELLETARARSELVRIKSAQTVQLWDQIEEKYPIGSLVHGTVLNLVKYGAFIEIEGGITGLLHKNDIHWTRKIKFPHEFIQLNQPITCKVLGIDKEQRHIALGLKQVTDDPWLTWIPEKYQAGKIIVGTVVKITYIGLFLTIANDLTGFLHVSELAGLQAENPDITIEVGTQINVKLIQVDLKKRRIKLGSSQTALIEESDEESDENTASTSRQPANQTQAHPKRESQERPNRYSNPLMAMNDQILSNLFDLLD